MNEHIISDAETVQESEISWEDAMSEWEQRENGLWDEFIRDSGYEDWKDFRVGPNGTLSKYGFSPLLEGISWAVLRVVDTAKTVGKIHTGPFKGWAIHNPNRNADGTGVREGIPFCSVISHGEILDNTRVASIYEHIISSDEPRTAMVLFGPDGRAVAPDGSHTLAAYAIAAHKGVSPKAPLLLHGGRVKDEHGEHFNDLLAGKIPL